MVPKLQNRTKLFLKMPHEETIRTSPMKSALAAALMALTSLPLFASSYYLADVKLFAQQGGEGVAVDKQGNVYLAAGQIFVYNPSGQLIETINIPERPSQLVFGGADGRTLFIAARTSLYA